MKECIHCKVCDTMCGFGGAGAFSDGKYNFTTAFGGWLTDFMPKREVMELIDYVDSINMARPYTMGRYWSNRGRNSASVIPEPPFVVCGHINKTAGRGRI